MGYTREFNELKSIFNQSVKEIKIPGSEIRIINQKFISEIKSNEFTDEKDFLISENISFSYPVFVPQNKNSKKVILLLHGLNERSWIKYLVWAFRLSQDTGSYVILFPTSFHINRTPESWIDPRVLVRFQSERSRNNRKIEMSSFANVALSDRLTDDPMRFFSSGYQTALDIISLMKQIRSGEDNIIPGGCEVNIFAYSIGAFLAQIMMMGNPEELFSGTRLFMLCGGSVFSNMKGTSKLIMDSVAYNRVYNFYLNDLEKEIDRRNPLFDFLRSSQLGLAFRSMIDLQRFKSFRENILEKLKGQIRSVALLRDRIIPAEGIIRTLDDGMNKTISVSVWDPPYNYSHENPFPVSGNKPDYEVDKFFDRIILEACSFFA